MRKVHTALLSTVALVAAFSIESASAADLAVKAPVAPVFAVPRWEGAFVSFSGGASWTKADTHFTDSGSSVQTETDSEPGFPTLITTSTSQFSGSDSQQSTNNNRTGGAVFT